jgi:uncharacterized protein YdeI (YjbR/CyaY-like superfamily)
MPLTDDRVDVYIEKAAPFAQPILIKLRQLVHHACPDVLENIKWGMPSFEYMGPMFGMAAFKQHCTGGFWKSKLLHDPKNFLGERKAQGGDAMGNLGRIAAVKELPPDKVIIDFIKQHMLLNEQGIKVEKKPAVKKELIIPKELTNALKQNRKAKEVFENFSPSHKREYAEWIADAKTEITRNKRLETTLEWLTQGKSRMWKYTNKK